MTDSKQAWRRHWPAITSGCAVACKGWGFGSSPYRRLSGGEWPDGPETSPTAVLKSSPKATAGRSTSLWAACGAGLLAPGWKMSASSGRYRVRYTGFKFDDTETTATVDTVTSVEFPTYLATRGRLIDDTIEAALPPSEQPPQIIHQAMRYSVLGGGKHLRPLLVVASAEACGGNPRAVLPVACAVELIHAYSLIHDDLPAMDNSDTRRGRPTCHIAFGEAIAVLAGDALHALAFELIARASPRCDSQRVLAVSQDIAKSIGTAGMVGGQVLDLLGEGRTFPGGTNSPPPAPLAELVPEIHLRKTAALIAACVRAGALLAGAEPSTLHALSAYGERLGLAFQIIDDILDIVGDDRVLGKRAGSDAAKATYPAAFGVTRSRDMAAQLTAQAVESLAPLGDRGVILQELARSLLARER